MVPAVQAGLEVEVMAVMEVEVMAVMEEQLEPVVRMEVVVVLIGPVERDKALLFHL